jgi:copper resistance protein B
MKLSYDVSKQLATTFVGPALLALVLLPGSVQAESKKGWPVPMDDTTTYSKLMIDRLEYASGNNDEDTVNWDAQFWYGGDYNRLYIETEGEDFASGGQGGEIENFDILYSRLISPYWDFQAGVGYQRRYGPGPDQERGSAVVGFQGLAPYWFEVDANLRVSDNGDASADLEAEYDLLFTQRLILQGRFATAYAASQVEEFGVGKGFNNVRLGLRLRYEIRREFAPYIGVSWNKLLGDTADLAKLDGEKTEVTSVLAGVRMWF